MEGRPESRLRGIFLLIRDVMHPARADGAAVEYLWNDENGFIKLTDKSSPEAIKSILQMSKKSFKKAVGTLYKQRQIRIELDGIYLIT